MIFVDDHHPPHVHVRGRGEARIALDPPSVLLTNKGMRQPDIVRALNAVEARREELMATWTDLMADVLSDAEFEAANEAGRVEFVTKPHAKTAIYDRRTKLMTLTLYNGCTFTFPPREVQGMANATDEQIEAVDIGLVGYDLHWEELDADVSVPGLLAGRFGSARFMKAQEARLASAYEKVLRRADDHDWSAQAAE